MNKISSLDIRIAVLAYPLVAKEERDPIAISLKPMAPFSGDERIISLFQNSSKIFIEPSRSRVPALLRKGQFALIRIVEILKTLLQEKEKINILADVVPQRQLQVPQLPHPPFQTPKPPRFFWHPAYTPHRDEYTPSCLVSETKEDLPIIVYNSASICAYARSTLPKQGILRQNHEGFVYLELPDTFITDLCPLISDQECETVPLYEGIAKLALEAKYLEPSPAHIPVILSHEWTQKKGWGEIKGLENNFSFEITRLCSLRPRCWPGVEMVYYLSLKSSELEKFRERCLLPSRIRGHEFHIAIAYKKVKTASQAPQKKETFRLNVSCFAA